MGFIGKAMTTQNKFNVDPNAIQAKLANTNYGGYITDAATQQAVQNQQQGELVNQLQQQAAGQGPSLAQQQLIDATGRAQQQAAGQMASARGMNPAMAARMILQNQAAQGQQAAGQSAAMRMQEQMGAREQLANALNQQRQANMGMFGQAGQLQQGQNQGILQAQLGAAGINAGVAQQNAQATNQATQGFVGGLMSGGAKALTGGMSTGGKVPGNPVVDGDSPINDTVSAKLSPGEIVIPRSHSNDPEKAKQFIDGLAKFKKENMPKEGFGKLVAKHKELDARLKHIEKMFGGGAVKGYADGTEGAGEEDMADNDPDVGGTEPETAENNPPETIAAPAQEQVDQTAQGLAGNAPLPGSPNPAEMGQGSSYGELGQQAVGEYKEALGHQAAAAEGTQQAKVSEGDQVKNVYKKLEDDMAGAQEQFNSHLTQINMQNETLRKNIESQKIEPNKLWSNMSTGNKIGSIIAMAIGGAVSGSTGGKNLALDTINNAIDNDIKQQYSEMDKKNNLLKQNMAKYGDMTQAMAATKANLMAAAQAKIGMITAQSQSATAKAGGEALKADLLAKQSQLHQSMAYQSLKGDLSKGAAGIPNEIIERMPQADKERVVTLEGNKKILAPTKKDADDIKAFSTAQSTFQDTISDMRKVAEKAEGVGGILGGITGVGETAHEAAALRNKAIAQLAQLQKQTRMSPEVIKQLKAQIPDPANPAHSTERINRELDLLQNTINSKFEAEKKSRLGIAGPKINVKSGV